jgi:hypothetical protein
MKILAWLFGVIAVVGSIALGANWMALRKGLSESEVARKRFAEVLENWKSVAQMEYEHLGSEVENDYLEIRSDELDVSIANLRGKSTAAAREALFQARAKLMTDQITLLYAQKGVRSGLQDSRVVMAQQLLEAAASSHAHFAACRRRDVTLTYAFGVVWLAFGFATALAARKPTERI